mgnify:CR=1 FL=1
MSYDLSKSDYDILAYINQYDHVSKEQIIGHFNGKIDAIEYRLNNLSSPVYSEGVKSLLPHPEYIEEEMKIIDLGDEFLPSFTSKNMYHITDVGRKALDDYHTEHKVGLRKRWLNRLWGFLSGVAITILAELILLWVSKWL